MIDALDALDAPALRSIIEGTLSYTGDALFDSLVEQLGPLLGTRFAFVGELLPGKPDQARMLAVRVDGRPGGNPVYHLRGTPCELAASRGMAYVASGILTQYPDDAVAQELGMDCYLGASLRDAHGEVVGILGVGHDAPLGDPTTARAILALFAQRAGAEMVRMRDERRTAATSAALLRNRSALFDLARNHETDFGAAVRAILQADATTIDVVRVSYWELGRDRRDIVCREMYDGSTRSFTAGAVLRADACPAYFEAMLSTQPILADDARTDPRTAEFADGYLDVHGITSMLDVPVWHRGTLAGVLCHEHVGPRRSWREPEVDFAVAAAGLVALALEAAERARIEERYRLIARATNDILWELDLRSSRLEWGDGVARFGYDPAEVEHGLAWWEARVHAEDRAPVSASLEAAIARGDDTWSAEYRFRRADGSYAVVTDSALTVKDASGAPARMVGAMVDVTERRALEMRLALADRMASVGRLATGVAHEVNNPLAYTLANVEYALDVLGTGEMSSEVMAALRDAREGAIRVRDIVRDLRTFSRAEEERKIVVDLRRVIDSSINVAWSEIRHRARLLKDLRPTPTVTANEGRLGQVVLNLLVNAAHAIPDGDVEANVICVVTRTDRQGHAVIEVHDTGTGIEPAVRARMFEPFFTTKRIGDGTGLGLSICHSIVTSLGGEISVESERGRGSTFSVRLPPGVPVRPPSRVPSAQRSSTPRRASVLVVDDDPLVGIALTRALAAEHDVSHTTRGRDAIAQVHAGKRYDVIICDVMMPEMSGAELCAELARVDPGLLERVILMTGGAFTSGGRELIEGFSGPVLEKPVDVDVLRALVRSTAR